FSLSPEKKTPPGAPPPRHKTPAARRFWTGLPVFCLSALCLAYMASVPRLTALGAVDIRYDQYNNYMKNGFMAATLLNFTDSGVKAPKGYGAGMMAELRERIIAEPEPPAMGQPPKKPHIIVLQMEAYGDPGFIDPRVAYREDPFGPLAPYEGELQRFRTLTSVLGGGTANTEYEFLTGYNTYFCPPGAIPFIRYLHGPKPSLAADLAELGYSSVVMHPHKGSFYSRTSAYGRLGFDRFVTQEEFDDPVYIGHYISDGSFGRKVLEIYEEEKGQGPLFLYGISIQNHGPYSNPDHHRRYALALGEGLALSGVQIMELETYGANLRDASAMLAELIRYFSAQSEPILLLVYGDHQAAWSWVHGLPAGADLDMRRYSSEGFFWANYPLEDDGRPLISVSGLGPRMMRKAGLPLPLYQKGIDLQFREVLAYNVAVTVENDGSVRYITPEGAGAFQPLQYDRMFGKNYLEQRD
ncbi:MAG: LTA synthase family protein, partial [Clostridiales bacterium]|nr:LTA synthase family protein [Clostridiales bacterium]